MGALRVLLVQHVPWEGPHRIGRALIDAGFEVANCRPLDGERLPPLDDLAAAVFMGGPMNVDQLEQYPGLLAEREWIAAAIAADLPMLGVCLGSQLIARAVGAEVVSGPGPEIGWLPVTILDAEDPVLGSLAPTASVLHWHGDVFDLPEGAVHLASSNATAVQAFRIRNAWGMLFHAEADAELIDVWLAEESMRAEAIAANGPAAADELRAGAEAAAARLTPASDQAFAAFAAFAAAHAR